MNRSIKDGLVLGTILIVIHSFASFLVFLYCHVDDDSQAVFAYFLFFVVDAPTVPLAFEIEGKIGLLAGLTDAWTDLWYHGHQGVNLRDWFAIGNLMSYAFRWIQPLRVREPA